MAKDDCINETIRRMGIQATANVVKILGDLWDNAQFDFCTGLATRPLPPDEGETTK